MRNLVLGILISLLTATPALSGAVTCPETASGLVQNPIAQRVDETHALLGSMFMGTPIQAASAVDYVSNQIDHRILQEGKSGEVINAVTQDPTKPETALSQLDVYKTKMETLKQVLEKNVSRFQFGGEQKLLKDIQTHLTATKQESDKAEALTTALQSQIAELRGRQEQAALWETAINAEVLFVEELLKQLRTQAMESQSLRALENFETEILPRLVGKSNGIVAALSVARATGIHLKSEVQTRQGILASLMDLKTIQPNLVQRAKERIGNQIETANQNSEQDSRNISACISGGLCIGEPVVAWTLGYSQSASSGYDGDVVVGIFADGRYSVKDKKGEIRTYSRSSIAKATKGLSSGGVRVGDNVVCLDGNRWKVAGIFPDGGFLLQVQRRKLGFLVGVGQFVRSQRFEFTPTK